MPKVFQRKAARCDLVEHFVYLAENISIVKAERFLTNAEISFNELALMPLIGSPLNTTEAGICGHAEMEGQGF
jgi:toxin ParE1/3/4